MVAKGIVVSLGLLVEDLKTKVKREHPGQGLSMWLLYDLMAYNERIN